jgi:hypothetical protein
MGKRTPHFLLKDGRVVVCARCMDRRHFWGNDQLDKFGSRAAIACLLGVWP